MKRTIKVIYSSVTYDVVLRTGELNGSPDSDVEIKHKGEYVFGETARAISNFLYAKDWDAITPRSTLTCPQYKHILVRSTEGTLYLNNDGTVDHINGDRAMITKYALCRFLFEENNQYWHLDKGHRYESYDILDLAYLDADKKKIPANSSWRKDTKENLILQGINPYGNRTGKLVKVVSRDGSEYGYALPNSASKCNLEGCRGTRHRVLWNDGKYTNPCTHGIKMIDKTEWRIL